MSNASRSELTPAQRRTLADLGSGRADLPTFPDGLGSRLRAHLDAGMTEVVDDLGPEEELVLTKHLLGQVHGCEVRFVAEGGNDEFVVSVPIARGTVAHKAIELGIHWNREAHPLELVDEAVARITEGSHWLTDFLSTASEVERAELRAESGDRVAKFFECFPPLSARWRPVTESSLYVDLADGRVLLRGKVDLTLGTARGDRAGKVIIDLKTGRPSPTHRDDLRFYALLETIRLGVPPRLVASFYLDAGVAATEAVTEALLESTVARTVDAARRVVALRAGTAAPVHRPSPACRWCPVLEACTVGRRWLSDESDWDEDLDAP